MIKKRRAGGGRKPKGAFSTLTAPLTIRMPAEMREQLKIAAKANGTNVSQEMMRRLQQSFDRDDDWATNDPVTRGLTAILHEVIGYVSESYEGHIYDGKPDWDSDPFGFATFRLALGKLLGAMQPKGKIVPPFDWKRLIEKCEFKSEEEKNLASFSLASFKSPEARSEYIANWIWSALHRTSPPGLFEDPRDGERWVLRQTDMRRDLGLNSKRKKL